MPRQSIKTMRKTTMSELFWDLLTFDRLLTGPVIHLIYWAGLALIVLGGFGVIGGAFGVAMREEGLFGWLLAIPVAVGGFLVLAAVVLLWRSFCELYVALFRIAEDLRAIRNASDRGVSSPLSAPRPDEQRPL
jgi:uncharacterized membrane protein